MSTIQNAFLDAFQGKRPEQPKITDFEIEEVGALVAAVGMIAHARGLYIGTVQDGLSDELLVKILTESPYHIDEDRAAKLIKFKLDDHFEEVMYGEGR